ncbi:hypothetical protein ACIQ4I_08575 [Rummeliibacillus sp. NPDC094406]|uniref:hypothetical protein n=1 Tax=Rummeliibacillus sp. NPDC094406 TaxID=3364511 RepID=UPI00380BBF1C
MLFTVHFIEKKTVVLSQLLRSIPLIDDPIKIKGRKGKVVDVEFVDQNKINVYVIFEIVKKKQPLAFDPKKRRR